MIAILKPTCTLREKAQLVEFLEQRGFRVHLDKNAEREWVGVLGDGAQALERELAAFAAIEELKQESAPYVRAARALRGESTVVRLGPIALGGPEVVVMAGPCAVESEEQIFTTAAAVAAAGARMLRGGAYKPRTSPYSFQGLGQEGLELMAAAGKAHGLAIVTEVVAAEDVERVARLADMLQVGARNMQNFRLLEAVGKSGRPVLLKRGLVATLEELLLAAEYVLDAGNPEVILCERGIRTFVRETRNTLDLAAIPLLKQKSHLPVIADPSHGTGVRALVPPLAKAALAAGADGLIIEVHPDPARALSDGAQSLTLDGFAELMGSLDPLTRALGRSLAVHSAPRGTVDEKLHPANSVGGEK